MERLSPDEVEVLLGKALPPYYEAVGEIASIWAMFEQRMDQLIWDLMNVEHKLGACVTSQLNGPGPRFRILRALLELREWREEAQKKLNKMSHEIVAVQEMRNRAVHDVVLVGHETQRVFRRTVATVQNKLVFEVVEHSVEVLKEVSKKSIALLFKFGEIQDEIRTSLPVLSDSKVHDLRWRHGPLDEGPLPIDVLSEPRTKSVGKQARRHKKAEEC